MKSNVTVGPPIDMLVYYEGELDVTRRRRFLENDSDLIKIRSRWQQALRHAVARLPNIRLKSTAAPGTPREESIQLVEGEGNGETQATMGEAAGAKAQTRQA
jgi:predicted proteasome-type protease